jgi:hypothetical protein
MLVRTGFLLLLSLHLLVLCVVPSAAGPSADPWSFWEANDPGSKILVDHNPWDLFLKKYLVTNHPSDINRVRYASVTQEDRSALDDYIRHLQQVAVTRLPRDEQKAYWINLYNALTMKVVLDHYPVKSIRDINISPGIISRGPWGAKLLTIQGEKVSLYTAQNTEALLGKGAQEYVNHARGVSVTRDRLYLSGIYKWFQTDFGGSEESVVHHLQRYAMPELAEKLKNFKGKVSYDYDWRINGMSSE